MTPARFGHVQDPPVTCMEHLISAQAPVPPRSMCAAPATKQSTAIRSTPSLPASRPSMRAIMPDGSIHPLAHVRFHYTHALGYKGGIGWCWACGSWTTGACPRNLVARCNGAPTSAAGHAVKARVCQGLTPVRGMPWPLPDDVGPPPGPLRLARSTAPEWLRICHRTRRRRS